MSCNETRARLDELVDGSLDDAARRQVETHLRRCPECRRRLEGLQALRARVQTLPRAIEPPRDLWRGIVARIEDGEVIRGRFSPAPRPWWAHRGLLAAAAALLVIASSGLTALFLRGGDPSPALPRPGEEITAETVAWRQFSDAERQYRQVTDELARELEQRRDELAPETVRIVEENLEIIDEAIRETRNALERDPANAGLATKLTDIYRKKADFLRAIVRL